MAVFVLGRVVGMFCDMGGEFIMDMDIYRESIQYEQLTQSIYQAILQNDYGENIQVEHNVEVKGKSGVAHQIDVLWSFKLGNVKHTVLIECKNYASNLTLEKVRNFFGVLHDIGNVQGIIVTKTGFQSGAAEYANYYGIDLKLLRKPNDQDWEGRMKDLHLHIIAKTVASSEDKPLRVQLKLKSEDDIQRKYLEEQIKGGNLTIESGPKLRLLDKNGNVCSEEMRWWLPKQIKVLDKEDGGPYTQDIKLDDRYVIVNQGKHDEQLIQIEGFDVSYYVESYSHEIISHGEEIVDAILKDFNTNEVEYVKKKYE